MYFQHLTASVGTGMYNISVTVLKKLSKPIQIHTIMPNTNLKKKMTKHWKQVRVHKHLLANEFYLLKRQTKDGLKT